MAIYHEVAPFYQTNSVKLKCESPSASGLRSSSPVAMAAIASHFESLCKPATVFYQLQETLIIFY